MVKKKESAIEVKVGALVVFSLALLGGFIYLLGDFGFDEGVVVYVDYQDIAGLKPGAAVKHGGIIVGKVRDIRFMDGEPSPRTGDPIWARVELEIEPDRFGAVRQHSEFHITTEGVLGEKFVSIRTEDVKDEVVEPEHVFRGVDPIRIEEVIAKVSQSVDNLNELLGASDLDLGQVVRHVDELVVNANAILEENRPQIGTILTNVDELIVNANGVVTDNRETLRSVLTNTDALVVDAQQGVRSFSRVAQRVDGRIDPVVDKVTVVLDNAERLTASVARITEDAEPKVATILDGAGAAVADVERASGDVASLVRYVHEGQGTVGLLIRDEEIFDNIREMLRELKRRPWKIVWKE